MSNGKGKHKGARCQYCATEWKRGRVQEMKVHLAQHCKKRVPRDIQLILLQELDNEINNQEIEDNNTSETSFVKTATTKSKRRKIDEKVMLPLEAYYDTTSIDDAKVARANKALIRWFVCSGIPFVAADSPFFEDFTKSLNYAYNLPKRTALSTTHLEAEMANIVLKMEKEFSKGKNLTLCK